MKEECLRELNEEELMSSEPSPIENADENTCSKLINLYQTFMNQQTVDQSVSRSNQEIRLTTDEKVEKEIKRFGLIETESIFDHKGNFKKFDLLLWWKTHEVSFPYLAKVARRILAIPATSASSERIFSEGKNVVTDIRNSLSEELVSDIIFLKNCYEEICSIEEFSGI